jgi:RNA polymerase sigma-70 factor (ECF subfamily)
MAVFLNFRRKPDAAAILLPHLDAAYGYARWLVRDPTLAQDVVQEAALRALKYFPSYGGENPRAWFFTILRNTASTMLAANAARATETLSESHPIADPAPNPESTAHARQLTDRLGQLIEALPAELRECLVLRELEDMSYKEIAAITGAPIGTVMSRLFRARQTLIALAAEASAP